jgi:hypothetical protein
MALHRMMDFSLGISAFSSKLVATRPAFKVRAEYLKYCLHNEECVDFPREPSGIVKQFISDEADARLAKYLPLLPNAPPPPPEQEPPKLPEGVADAPLVRLFNFLRALYTSFYGQI